LTDNVLFIAEILRIDVLLIWWIIGGRIDRTTVAELTAVVRLIIGFAGRLKNEGFAH